MVGKEIVREVYEFIKKNPYCTKSEVERGVEVCTRLPIREAIEILMSDNDGTEEPKVKFSKNTPNGFYHLYVNDKNEYNNLMALIEKLEGLANKQETILSKIPELKQSKDTSLSKNMHNLLFFGALYFYFHITGITVAINARIKNVDDRESLHMRITKIILTGFRLNLAILPLVHFDLESLRNEVEQGGMANNLILNLYDLVGEVKKLQTNLEQT